MLLRLTLENFLSIREEVELSFVAAPLKERLDSLISSTYAPHGVLPVVALYGANASGKSNVLYAFSFLRKFILNSFSRDEDGGIARKPFLLDETSSAKPTRIVADFVLDGVRLQFGFSVDNVKVVSEWLYQYPNRVRQILYERNDLSFKFGRGLGGGNKQVQSITRPNALFLSAAAAAGHPELTRIRDYFRDRLVFQLSSTSNPDQSTALELEGNADLRNDVVMYLSMADTGISDLKVVRDSIPPEAQQQFAQFLDALHKFMGPPSQQVKLPPTDYNISIRLGHSGGDGKVRFLEYVDESLGTKYLLKLLPSVLKVLRSGSVLVLDEITTSLHTLLARKLVDLFHDKHINKSGAQLVFSTHDTNLLAPNLLRRDEVWFTEKGKDGATSLFPLTDIRTKNTDNIERGYIQGRFGAIPYLPEGFTLGAT